MSIAEGHMDRSDFGAECVSNAEQRCFIATLVIRLLAMPNCFASAWGIAVPSLEVRFRGHPLTHSVGSPSLTADGRIRLRNNLRVVR
jgi:hypothetical protein